MRQLFQLNLAPGSYTYLFKPTKKKVNIGIVLTGRNIISVSDRLQESSTNRPDASRTFLRMHKRDRQSEGKWGRKMVIWSEVRNETCHSKLEPCCLNYFGLLLKEKVCPRKQKQKNKLEVGRGDFETDKREAQWGGKGGENDMRGNLQWEDER